MSPEEQALESLLEALSFSPDNLPLRKHIISSLIDLNRYTEAEEHISKALKQAPRDEDLKLKLAKVSANLNKSSVAMVILEELIQSDHVRADAWLLHAELSFDQKEFEQAAESYQEAIKIDSSLRDMNFENQLAEQRSVSGEDYGGRVPVEYPDEDTGVRVERPVIDFSNVGGMEALKEEIDLKIIQPLKHPDLYKAYGKAVGGGILMYGPPGCGKTHLARATAGQVKAGFISVGINEILDMWTGNSEKNLHQIFQTARAQAPCVLFFDEVDALGASRSDMKKSGGRRLINQFLAELDGDKYSNEGVLILAATNTPWNMDSAFRRPGRFDRILFVPPPDEKARAAILKIMLKEKPTQGINLEKLAKKTHELSGADLKAVIDVAIEDKLRASMKAGKALPIEQEDLLKAATRVKASSKEWFSTARNYALYSNNGGLYDDILRYLNIKR